MSISYFDVYTPNGRPSQLGEPTWESSSAARSSHATMTKKLAVPTRPLAWWNATTAVLSIVPCSIVLYFPFLLSLAFEWRYRSLSRQFPEGHSIDLGDVFLPPMAGVYAAQVVLLAVPAVVASFFLFRRHLAGWWVSTAVLGIQAVLLPINLVSLSLCGAMGRAALGVSIGMALWACAFFLFLVNLLLLCRAAARSRLPAAAVR